MGQEAADRTAEGAVHGYSNYIDTPLRECWPASTIRCLPLRGRLWYSWSKRLTPAENRLTSSRARWARLLNGPRARLCAPRGALTAPHANQVKPQSPAHGGCVTAPHG